MEEEEIIAMIGSKAPFVIRVGDEEDVKEVEDRQLERVIISLSRLDLDQQPVTNTGKVKPVIIKLPPVEKYDPRAVHWDYGSGEIDAITRSGRCYPKETELDNKRVDKRDIEQLQSMVRTSEYEVIEQLSKMPAQISLLDLFTNSEKHKSALLRVLGEVQVPETINEVQLEEFIGAVWLKDQITFSDEDFPEEGRAHNKALYISVKCRGKTVSRVLVDNGSAFNLCSLSTIRSLGINEEAIGTSKATIRAFDGGAKQVIGEIELDVKIGPVSFSIPFQVLDIPSAFSFLLGRPWIHVAGAIPSSLHQKVRFVANNKLVTVHGEQAHLSYSSGLVPYIEPQGNLNYESLERITVMYVPEGNDKRKPELSSSAMMAAKVLLQHGFIPGKGLGRDGRGIKSPLQLPSNDHRYGLGYTGNLTSDKERGRGPRRGRGRLGGRHNRHAGTAEWKGQGKMTENPLTKVFARATKWLQDESVTDRAEFELAGLFRDDTINVIIEWLPDDAAQPE